MLQVVKLKEIVGKAKGKDKPKRPGPRRWRKDEG